MLDGVKKIHLIGIAGSGMRAIANILIHQGYTVSGSDVTESAVTRRFSDLGATIYIGHKAEYVEGVDAVVRSTAIREDNVELARARELGITILHRSDIVKAVIDTTTGIAVAGAHGKTTTTSMLGQIFVEGKKGPTIIIGGEVDYLQGSSCLGKGEYSIAEADESDGSFLKLHPKAIVITNIENDHMDHYQTMENLLKAFEEFVENMPLDGVAVVCGDNALIQGIMKKGKRTFVSYGLNDTNEYWADNIHYDKGILIYTIRHGAEVIGDISLQVPGIHNVLNSLGAYVMATQKGISLEDIQSALLKFKGAKRRFETKGHAAGVWVVDDYAHHPTEIEATLKAAKGLEEYRVVCVFQPHRYTRTSLLLNEFATAFEQADVLYITDIYSAGEDPIEGIDGHSIPDIIKEKTGKEVHYIPNVEDVPQILASAVKSHDLVITMGAGTINQYGPKILTLVEEG